MQKIILTLVTMLAFLTLINGNPMSVIISGTVTNSCGNPVPDGMIGVVTHKRR